MQYKKNAKIIIDKRKFETLRRLNCPKEVIIDLIFDNVLNKTGDELIDDNLETLLEVKEFKNWGGNHNPKGNNQYTFGQVDQLVDQGQNGGQEIGQVVDKDRDRDRDIYSTNKEKEKLKKEKEKQVLDSFNSFWKLYPRKKSRETALKAFKKSILAADPSTIMNGLKRYLEEIRVKNTTQEYIKHPATWLNQQCWEDEYITASINAPVVKPFANEKGEIDISVYNPGL